jgi:hypothetical protein
MASEGSSSFVGLSGLAGFAFAGDDDVSDAEVGQVIVDAGFAVAAVGSHRPRGPLGPFLHPFHGRFQPGRVGRIAGLDVVVEHDVVVVVADLCL